MELDLGDILDASALEADEDLGMMLRQPEETDGEGGNDAAEAAFERWARIPISAFRRARQEDMSAVEEALSPEKAVRRGSNGDEVYLPFSSAIFTSEGSLAALDLRSPHQKKGKRRKISRKDAIALSPMLCPVQTSRAPSPNNIRSRKERRADKKKDRKTKSSTSQNARSSRSPAKADGSTAAEMLMPPSSTVLSHDPMSSSLSTSMGMGLAPVSPAPFNTFHDTEVPPLDLPASLVDFA